jgi:hypothetical protein
MIKIQSFIIKKFLKEPCICGKKRFESALKNPFQLCASCMKIKIHLILKTQIENREKEPEID